MKIAISGTHGVGKTTLAKSLAKKLNLPLIEEVARGVAQRYGFKNTEQIKKAENNKRYSFQHEVFYEQVAEESLKSSFISDRSVFDPLAYCLYYGIAIPDNWARMAELQSMSYDFIIYCPIPRYEISDDGFRLTDKNSQQYIDTTTRILLNYARCPVLELGKNRDNWEDEVMECIRKREKEKLPAELEPIAQLLKDNPKLLANVKTALERLDNDEMRNRRERE